MRSKKNWSHAGGTDPNIIRLLACNLSIYVRSLQYNVFLDLLRPTSKDNVLDVGTSPDERLKDTNFFEKTYPFRNKLNIASIENCQNIVEKYNLNKYIHLSPDTKMPFKDKSYDIVVSWATIEHIGERKKQKFYLNELCRVGKKVFLTTPDKLGFYDPHTATFFLHYLPPKYFRKLLKLMGKDFWAEEKNLNILSLKDVKELIQDTNLKVKRYKAFGIIPSHLLIYGETI